VSSFPKENSVRTCAFSILVPGGHILPHSGYVGYSDRVLRCHLGLDIPDTKIEDWDAMPRTRDWTFLAKPPYAGLGLRCGPHWETWNNGDLLVFDDSYVHEAWNSTTEPRLILLLDFNRPKKYMPPEDVLKEIEEKQAKIR